MADQSQNENSSAANSSPIRKQEWLDPWKFKPGQSGNPSGRPKKKWLTEVTEELLEEKLSDPEFRKTYKDALWKKLLSERVVGSMTLEKVWERTEGKVAQDVNLGGEVGIRTISERMAKAEERLKKVTDE